MERNSVNIYRTIKLESQLINILLNIISQLLCGVVGCEWLQCFRVICHGIKVTLTHIKFANIAKIILCWCLVASQFVIARTGQ